MAIDRDLTPLIRLQIDEVESPFILPLLNVVANRPPVVHLVVHDFVEREKAEEQAQGMALRISRIFNGGIEVIIHSGSIDTTFVQNAHVVLVASKHGWWIEKCRGVMDAHGKFVAYQPKSFKTTSGKEMPVTDKFDLKEWVDVGYLVNQVDTKDILIQRIKAESPQQEASITQSVLFLMKGIFLETTDCKVTVLTLKENCKDDTAAVLVNGIVLTVYPGMTEVAKARGCHEHVGKKVYIKPVDTIKE